METATKKHSTSKTGTKMTGSEAIVQCLIQEGIDTIYGSPGGAIMPVYDAMYDYKDQLTHILTRHEQGAIHAAQGYARVSGKVGACIATSGPGATNLVTGIADAQIDSTPVVCITGQVAKHLLGSDAFQETDIISISTPITKWNYQITKASEIPEVMAKAFYIAKSGRPGPVLIDITKNAQLEEFDFSYEKCTKIRSYIPETVVQKEQLNAAAELINQAKKPFIVFGQGVILGEAEKALQAFIEKAGIPSASTLLGLSALPSSHPLHVGMVGMHGHYAPNKLTNECDVLIAIGMRFDDRVTGDLNTYARQAKVVHFEIDPAEVSKNVKADAPVLGNVNQSLVQLLPLINKNNHDSWMNEFKKLSVEEHTIVIDDELTPKGDLMTMGEVIKEINALTNGEAVIVTDVGQHQMVACRYSQFNKTKSNITSGGLGTMGFSLPAAIGAKMAAPEREIISISGDGGIQMNIHELGTILQTKVGVKILILNNEYLGMVRQWQELFFDKRYAETPITSPDFITVAKGYGIDGQSVVDRKDLKNGIKAMLDSKEAYILEVKVEKNGKVFPMVPTGASVSDVILK